MSEWRYRLARQYTFFVPELVELAPETITGEWYMLQPEGYLTVKRGYAWDGASVVPDGKPLYILPAKFYCETLPGDYVRTTTRGTCWHDCVYQHLEELAAHLSLNVSQVRKIADDNFRDIIKQDGFGCPQLYWIGVRLFGGLWHGANRQTKKAGIDLSHLRR